MWVLFTTAQHVLGLGIEVDVLQIWRVAGNILNKQSGQLTRDGTKNSSL
jgi:hypothetical protein